MHSLTAWNFPRGLLPFLSIVDLNLFTTELLQLLNIHHLPTFAATQMLHGDQRYGADWHRSGIPSKGAANSYILGGREYSFFPVLRCICADFPQFYSLSNISKYSCQFHMESWLAETKWIQKLATTACSVIRVIQCWVTTQQPHETMTSIYESMML